MDQILLPGSHEFLFRSVTGGQCLNTMEAWREDRLSVATIVRVA